MGHLYVLRLRGNKWYVGYTDRSSVDRILEHIEKKGAKWTKAHPPLKKGYLHNFTTPGKTREDEDKYTLRLMKKHGIGNVRGGKWCMVKMRKKTFRELESLIATSNKKNPSKKEKRTTRRSRSKKCSRCGRTNHIKPNCYARTHADGRKLRQKEKVDSKVYEAFLRQKNAAKKAALEAEMSKKENQRKQNEINRLNREIKDLNAASEETNPEARLKILQTLSENDMEFLRKHLGKGLALVGVAGIAAAIAAPKAKQALSSAKKSGVEAGAKIRDIVSKKKSEWK